MSDFIHWKRLVMVSATVALLAGQSAFAASDTCWIPPPLIECTTESVSANSSSHHVHIHIAPELKYWVYDTDTGVIVGSGKSGWLGTRRTIVGLYNRYYVKAEPVWALPGQFATINNN